MKITVIGTGYVGLVTSACLAESGHTVIGVDKDTNKIRRLANGDVPIYEPGLHKLVRRNLAGDRLHFNTDLHEAVPAAQVIFIAVGTPANPDGSVDLTSLWDVAAGIARTANDVKIVVIKSTVPVGTNRDLAERFAKRSPHRIDVVSNPEFLRQGSAIEDFTNPNRIVVGVRCPEVAEILRQLYAPYLQRGCPCLVMSPESAEMTKHVANAMLATRISFINEMASLCEVMSADIQDVRHAIGYDPRIGFHVLSPGLGYGGSCLPKDVLALIAMARRVEMSADLIEAVHRVNQAQKHVLFDMIRQHFGQALAGKCLAIWGLAFKPDTDDIREAPALVLIDDLLRNGVVLRVHDPQAMENARRVYGDRLVYCEDPFEAIEDADGLAIVTDWPQFCIADILLMKKLLRNPVVFDGRNLFQPTAMSQRGFVYYFVGRRMKATLATNGEPHRQPTD